MAVVGDFVAELLSAIMVKQQTSQSSPRGPPFRGTEYRRIM